MINLTVYTAVTCTYGSRKPTNGSSCKYSHASAPPSKGAPSDKKPNKNPPPLKKDQKTPPKLLFKKPIVVSDSH